MELTEERVLLEATPEITEADASFIFTNLGKRDVELLVGFPEEPPPEGAEEFRHDLRLHDFRAWVNGKEVKIERLAGIPPSVYPAWYAFPVSIPAGEKVDIRNRYWVKNSRWSNGQVETGYILKTGALWAGPIRYARIELHLSGIPPYQLVDARPEGRLMSQSGRVHVWEFSDFEPAADIKLHFNTRLPLAFLEPVDPVDGLLLSGKYDRALVELMRLRGRTSTPATAEDWARLADPLPDEQRLSFREAYLLQMVGRTGAARELWETLININGTGGPRKPASSNDPVSKDSATK